MTDAGTSCSRCGQRNPPGAKFCLECGNTLAAPERRMREERKVVSVLFADLVDFTAQAEQLDPEEVRALLAPYHASLRDKLEAYGGTVEKFIGDAVMALFGAPVAHEDDAERAVRAALAIRDALGEEGRLHVRIGITSGETLVALEARPEGGEGMAAGDVVNTAARLQSAAPVDGILVDQATYRATARAIDYREHEPVTVKGKREPVAVYEAVAARARFGVDVRQHGQAPLVGRAREMELLGGALARAIDERQPQLVTLVGVPGIGKSRVVWELFGQADARSELIRWRQGRSLPYAESIAFWALGEIVKAEAGILETDAPAEAADKLGAAVETVLGKAAEAAWVRRHLEPLIGVTGGSEARGDHAGEAFAAWRQYIEALAEQGPLVVVFEDLHWADDGLLDFVDYLVDWASGIPLLVVGTSRPELLSRRPGWGGGKPNALTISLAPLSEADTRALVASLVEQQVLPASLSALVLERAQGNPLYAEEFARLVGERGHIDDLPETVQGIIAARLDGLARAEKELLQDAAVVGKVFWSGAVASMLGREGRDVEAALHALERREFVRRERSASVEGETEYAFRHILVRDVAYGQIPRSERGARHLAAADWIDSLGRPVDHAELLAQHYMAAIEYAGATGQASATFAERACSALRVAGERATSLNAFALAARYFKAALALMADDDAARAESLFGYGKALRFADEAGADVLAEAESRLRAVGNLELAAEAAVLQAELAWFAGQGEQTTTHLSRASELVDQLGPSFSKAYVLSDLSRYHMLRVETEAAVARGRQALALAEELGLDEIKAHALNNIGTARHDAGDLEGIADLERAVEIADAINSPELARALNNLGAALATVGDMRRGLQLQRRALERARELGNRSVERFVLPQLAWADYDDGFWNRALAAIDELLAEAESAGGHSQEAWMRLLRGRIALARGQVDEARREAGLGLAAARRVGDPQTVAPSLSFAAAMHSELGELPEALTLVDELCAIPKAGDYAGIDLILAMPRLGRTRELEEVVERMLPGRWRDVDELIAASRLTEAAELLDEMGSLSQAALVRLHAGRRLLAAGKADEARQQLDRAMAFWESVGASFYLRQCRELRATIEQPAAS